MGMWRSHSLLANASRRLIILFQFYDCHIFIHGLILRISFSNTYLRPQRYKFFLKNCKINHYSKDMTYRHPPDKIAEWCVNLKINQKIAESVIIHSPNVSLEIYEYKLSDDFIVKMPVFVALKMLFVSFLNKSWEKLNLL